MKFKLLKYVNNIFWGRGSSAIVSVGVFYVWPKTTHLLPMWPREAKRLDTPGVQPYACLTWGLNRREWSASCSVVLPAPRKNSPWYLSDRKLWGPPDPARRLSRREKYSIPANPNPYIVHQLRGRATGYAVHCKQTSTLHSDRLSLD
jgi:hypothetical protein